MRFAFAVNMDNKLGQQYFGNADKYLIYMQETGKIILSSEEVNKYKLLDQGKGYGLKKKGSAIIKLLREKNVHVLVARQFGKNITLVNKYFIPVKISSEHPEEIVSILSKHLHWIEDEWNNKKSDYGIFTIKKGILKSSIEK
jgi:predicted Fe-Mo cluster-binding NifX family protein